MTLCLPNMFESFPYRGANAPGASRYALARCCVEQISAHEHRKRTCPPSYSCLHLRGRPRSSEVQSQRWSIITTIQNSLNSNVTALGLTWSSAAKNTVHIRPMNTIVSRFLGTTCSSLSFHDAPGFSFSTGTPFCVVDAIYEQLGPGLPLCVKRVQFRPGDVGGLGRNGMGEN